MSHPPAYEEYEDKPRPVINWDTPDGRWVGIWDYYRANQTCIELSKVTNEFDFEVHQPDLRKNSN